MSNSRKNKRNSKRQQASGGGKKNSKRRKVSGGNKKSTKRRKGNGGSKISTSRLSGGNRRCMEGAKKREGERRREREKKKEDEGEKENEGENKNEGEKESDELMKNEEGDAIVAALREANLRIDKFSAGLQALEEVDGRMTTSRSSSSETEGEIWN